MPREIVVGNGKMAVTLDSRMRIRDFFYPSVGLENHLLGHEFRIGAWVDDKFTWLGDNWDITMKYLPETLVCRASAKNDELKIELEIDDTVHNFLNIYLIKVVVNKLSDLKE